MTSRIPNHKKQKQKKTTKKQNKKKKQQNTLFLVVYRFYCNALFHSQTRCRVIKNYLLFCEKQFIHVEHGDVRSINTASALTSKHYWVMTDKRITLLLGAGILLRPRISRYFLASYDCIIYGQIRNYRTIKHNN